MKADAIGLLMNIDTVIYGFIDYVYDIFNALAKVNIFDIEDYKTIVRNIYVVLGMVMLFALAYSLLRAVINPDEFAKGDNSFPKLVKNVVISLAIIAILPSAFTLAFNVQNTILNQDTIPKLVFGTGEDYNNATRDDAGKMMSYYVLSAFLHPNIEWCDQSDYATDDGDGGDINLSSCASNIKGDGGWLVTNGEDLKSVTEKFKAGTYGISAFNDFGESAAAGKLTYNALVSTIAGAFMLYVLLNFCFDMAVRVVKLMFFQIIAPIPVVCRVIPGGKLKEVFSDWMKKTISTYVEVFIRIAIMYLGVFMISQVVGNFENVSFGGLGATQKLIAKALIIMGVVIFMRQAPKLIGDMFHLDSGSMKLGLMDKLAMGGALAAASTVGGAGGMLLKNGASAIKNFHETKGKGLGARVGAAVRGVGSTVAGTASGAARGFKAGKGAKNMGDVKKASNSAIDGALAAKAKRAAYREAHKETAYKHGFSNYLGTTANVVGSHILDTAGRVGEFIGINNSAQDLIDENKLIDDIAGKKKSVATSVESVIDKEAGKSSSSFKVGNYTAAELRKRLLAIDDAKAGNLKDAAGNTITVAQAQQMYDQYRYDFSQAAQNVAFLSDEHFENLSRSADKDVRDVYVKLAGAHANAEGMREAVSRNLDKSYVQDAGFTLEYVQGDMKVDAAGKPLKSMGDIFDVAKARNEGEIARRQRAESANNDKK